MSSVRQSAVSAFYTLLNTSPPTGVPSFGRAKDSIDIEPADLPDAQMVSVLDRLKPVPAGAERPPGRGPLMHRLLTIGVVGWFVPATTTDAADDMSEATLAHIEACVAKLRAQVAGVLVAYVGQASWEVKSGNKPYCRLIVAVEVEYTHRTGDATQPA